MRRQLASDRFRRLPSGFTLLETLVVVAILLIMMAGVFAQINKLQSVFKGETTKVDATQESRNLLDEIGRELHQSGYPGANLFAPTVLLNLVANDARVAVGLVRVAPAELWFEGDFDLDGTVDVVNYRLMDSAGNLAGAASTCPCTLQRSQQPKANAAPLAQAPVYTSGLNNVINSGGVGAGGAPLALVGGAGAGAYDLVYAGYKTPPVFAALDQNGNAVAMPVDVTNAVALATVKAVVVNLNTLTLQEENESRQRVPVTMTMTAKINN